MSKIVINEDVLKMLNEQLNDNLCPTNILKNNPVGKKKYDDICKDLWENGDVSENGECCLKCVRKFIIEDLVTIGD